MGKASWICFDCRKAVRRETHYAGMIECPNCGKPMRYLGYKIPVPPKRSIRKWESLRLQLAQERQVDEQQAFEAAVRHRHSTEQEIEQLESMGPNAGRERTIRLLRKQLDAD